MNKCCSSRSIAVLSTIAAALVLLFSNAPPAFAGKSVNLLSYTNHNGTDDQTGIMNAFNAAGPYGKVIAPAGYTWLHSGQLVAPPGLSLVGGGTSAVFKATNNSAGALVLSGGSSVFNLTIEYANASGSSSPPDPPYPDPNLAASGIVIQSATKVSVLSVNIPSASDNSIAVIGSNNVSISNCQIGTGFNSGVLLATSWGVQITGNTFSSQIINIVSGSFYTVNNNTFINTGGAVSTLQVANSQFNNNIIQNGSKPVYADFSFSGQTTNIVINGNTMEMVNGSTITENTLWSQAIFFLNLSSASNLSGVTISNNLINGGCSSRAIYISGAGTNINICKNTFTNIGTNCLNSKTIPGYGAIDWSSCSGTISGNTFNTVNSFALAVTSSPYNPIPPPITVQIKNNTASNCYMYQSPSFELHNPAFNVAAIIVTAGKYQSVSIDGNSYTGGGDLGYFVDCSQPGVEESGNNGGLLPSYYAP